MVGSGAAAIQRKRRRHSIECDPGCSGKAYAISFDPVNDIQIHGPAFEAMMRDVDAKLTAEGGDVANRPMMAVGEVSTRHGTICSPRPRTAMSSSIRWRSTDRSIVG
jgi:hypothetical protein